MIRLDCEKEFWGSEKLEKVTHLLDEDEAARPVYWHSVGPQSLSVDLHFRVSLSTREDKSRESWKLNLSEARKRQTYICSSGFEHCSPGRNKIRVGPLQRQLDPPSFLSEGVEESVGHGCSIALSVGAG
jgi:hypothetical protein